MVNKSIATDISGGLPSRETLADRLDLPLKEEGCGDHGSNNALPINTIRFMNYA